MGWLVLPSVLAVFRNIIDLQALRGCMRTWAMGRGGASGGGLSVSPQPHMPPSPVTVHALAVLRSQALQVRAAHNAAAITQKVFFDVVSLCMGMHAADNSCR